VVAENPDTDTPVETAVDQVGITVWQFADRTGTVRSVGIANNNGAWAIQHRNFDQFGKKINFPAAKLNGMKLPSSEK
jgi:hypothetical protein